MGIVRSKFFFKNFDFFIIICLFKVSFVEQMGVHNPIRFFAQSAQLAFSSQISYLMTKAYCRIEMSWVVYKLFPGSREERRDARWKDLPCVYQMSGYYLVGSSVNNPYN